MEFITGLPIVETIKNAIETIIGAVLKPVTDVLGSIMETILPAFPDISLNILPLSFFDNFSFNLPELPDLSSIANIPDKLLASLPGLPAEIKECGSDIGCYASLVGLNTTMMFISELNQFTVQNNQFSSMGEGTCKLDVMESGELPEFKSDCDICVCGKNNQMCKNCYN